MDISQQLHELESRLDWHGLAARLEKAIAETSEPEAQAVHHLRLGRVLAEKLLQPTLALRHFKAAWTGLPHALEPLARARTAYWELGKFDTVHTVLQRMLDVAEPDAKAELLCELGDVSCDLGNGDGAAEYFKQAVELGGAAAAYAEIRLGDLQADDATWKAETSTLQQAAEAATDVAERVTMLLRAARIAMRFDAEAYESLLQEAYRADPHSAQATALFEERHVTRGRLEALEATQRAMLGDATVDEAATMACRFGARWAVRHQNTTLATAFFQECIARRPADDVAFAGLLRLAIQKDQWPAALALGAELTERGVQAPHVAAGVARAAWRGLKDERNARVWFEQLATLAPEHPSLAEYEAEIGEQLPRGDAARASAAATTAGPDTDTDDAPAVEDDVAGAAAPEPDEPASAEPAAPPADDADAGAEAPEAVAEESSEAAEAELAAASPEPADALSEPAEPGAERVQDDDHIAALVARAEEQLAAKKNHDYVKTLVEIAEAYVDPYGKVEYFAKAADVYLKFQNAAEASKCFESIVVIDPQHEVAIEYLRGYYEKRRDWERLIGLLRMEADGQADADFRLAKYIEMAQLASERIKKPEICIELWAKVREIDENNPDALDALSTFYERARDWENLASVLTQQVLSTLDEPARAKMLEKLAQIQGDRLNNDEAAADAWRQLLEINPTDRRAQEALKKKLLALRRWDDLELLYEESGKWDEFIRLLESQEAREAEPATKIGLLFKVADLYQTRKGALDRAARAYEKILGIDGNHLGAAEALVPIYEDADNPKGLASALEVKISHVEDDGERLGLLRQLAGLYESKLRKPDLAYERYLSALAIAPEDSVSAEDAERAAKTTGGWEALVGAYREALGKVATPDAEAALRLRLGRVLLEQMQKVDEALEQYRAVYELDPENGDALAALERLYRETGRHPDLLAVYEKQRELAQTPEQQARVLFAIAELQERELGDAKNAIQSYWQVLDLDATEPNALAALDRLYLGLEEWEPYADVLRRRLETDLSEAQIIDLKFRLGQTLEKHLGEPAGALENYREILFIDPGNDQGRVALEGLLKEPDLSAEVARILVEVYEGREEWDKLIGVLEILVNAEDEPTERVRLLRKIGMAASEQLGDVTRAFDAQARALREAPENPEVRLELEDYAERGNAHERLAQVLAEIAAELTDSDLARAYWLRLASIYEVLNQVDQAASCYVRVLEIDPADGPALDAMEALFSAHKRWEDLVGVVRRRIDLADDVQQRETLYARMATVYETELKQPEQAIAAYCEVLAVDDASLLALRALDGLYSRQRLFPQLGENLEAQLRLAESEQEEIGLMLRLAALQETELGVVPMAIETYRQVLERVPSEPTALAALERLGKLPEHEVEIADILGPLYRDLNDHQKLLGVYEVQVRTSDDPNRKVELLHEMAELYEEAADNLNAAFDTLARALEFDPAAEHTHQNFARLARATERHADLARVYQEQAAAQQDVELGIYLYTMSAQAYERDLRNMDAAVGLYRKILELDPQRLEAAEALEGIFRATDRFDELSLTLQQKADLLTDAEQQKLSLLQAADIEESVLERRESAVAVFKKVLEVDPEELRAVDALIRLFVSMERWTELLEMYNRRVDLVFEDEERKSIYYQIGAVHERELGNVRAAIDTYQRVLEIDPQDLGALGHLDRLYQQAEDWPELLTILQQEADLAADIAESISFQYRIAELYDKRLDDVSRAIELYAELLRQQMDHQPTLAALDALTRGEREPVAAALVLEPIYETMEQFKLLIEVLEVQVRHSDDSFQKVELLKRIAKLYEDMLENAPAAFETWARAIVLDVSNEELLSQYERLAAFVGRWPDLAALYDQQLDALADDPLRFAELGLRLARIYEGELQDFDNAIKRYVRVIGVEAENINAIEALDRLYEETGRYQELAAILAREAELAGAPEDSLQFRYRLGKVQLEHLKDTNAAIASFGEVLGDMPEHESALRALEELFYQNVEQQRIAEVLEPLYESQATFDKLVGVYEALLAHQSDPLERMNQYYRLADLHEEKLLSPDGALGVYVRAMLENPKDERTLEAVERLADLVESGWEQLANAYADVLGTHSDVEVQKLVGKRLARTFEERLGDVTKAEETYRYVLGVAPLEVECLENLDRIYASLEQNAELAGVLEQRVQTTDDTFQLVEFYMRLGEIYEQRLVMLDDAVRVYRRIFDQLEPENEVAQSVLERIYIQKQAWHELLGVYERQLKQAPGPYEEAEISAKMGRVLSDQLGDMPRSIETWKRVLEIRGDDNEALSALADLYERTQQWGELTEVLERHMGLVMDDQEQVAVLLRRARLFSQQLGRDDSALEDYYRVLDIDYGNFEALYAINEIYRRTNQTERLMEALHQTIDRAGQQLPAEHLVALCREVAKLHQGAEQPVDAMEAWRRLLETDPRDFEAMAELEGLLRADQRLEEVVDVKMMRARAFTDPAEQVREYREVVDIWTHQLQNEDGATQALDAILAIEPRHDVAFKTQEKLHSQANRNEALLELYLNRLDHSEAPEERCDLLRRVAKVYSERLNETQLAYEALQTALEIDFTDPDTVAALEKAAHAANRWPELLQLVNHWLENQPDPKLQIVLCLHLAKWYGEELGRLDYAQPYFQKVLRLDPNNVGVLRQMAAFHKKNGRWKEQGQMLQKALEVATQKAERAAILTDMGEVLEKHLDQADKGLDHYQRALLEEPLYLLAIEALERIYDERRLYQELADILGSKARALTETAEVAETKLRRAKLLETTLAQLEPAADVYNEILEIEPGNLEAIRGLERVYGTLQRWPDLLRVLEIHLDVNVIERERIEVLMHIARLQEEQFVKPDLAVLRLEQVVEVDSNYEPAYEGLARCYVRLRQWLDLVGCYERHINATDDRQKKISLYWEIARTQTEELQDQQRALDAYLAIVDLDPDHVPALEQLARLYERMDDPANAIDYMQRVAERTVDGNQRVEAYYRIGKQYEEKLGDRGQARDNFERAIDLNPIHVPTLSALRTIALDEQDWALGARYLDTEQQNTESSRERAKLLVDLGRIRDEMLEQHDLAVEAYQLALQADDDNEDAALPLAREYERVGRFPEAEPLAEMLVRKSGKREREEQLDLHLLYARITAALKKFDLALKAYQAAHKLDLTNQEAVRGLADINFELGDWAGALTNYQKVLTSLGEDDHALRAEVYYKLGCVKRAQGQGKQAINNWEKGLAIDAAHRPTLEALVALYQEVNDWTQACVYRRQIIESILDGDEKYALLKDLGDIFTDKVGDPMLALKAYEQAAEIKPEDHLLLHKMLQLYQKTNQWERVVEALQRIAEADPNPERRSRYLFTMGQAYRDKLNDPYHAAELFDEALDLNPEYLEAFKRVDKIFTSLKDWAKLERAYRKMIHRLVGRGKADIEFSLWHALGLIYRDRLQDPDRAVEAFTAATAIKPENVDEELILADLGEQRGKPDEALKHYRRVLKLDPMHVDAYRAIYNVYLQREAYDESWCCASVLAFLNRANEEEQRFFEDWRPTDIPRVTGRLNTELWWNHMFHEDQDKYIGKIFESVALAALKAKLVALKAKNEMPVLPDQFRQDPASSTISFARTFWWAGEVLGIRPPLLYARSDVPGGLVAVPAEPPASIAGQGVLTGLSALERSFVAGKHLAMYRGEHYIKTLFPTITELTVILFAAMQMVSTETPTPKEIAPQVKATAESLSKYMQPMQREQLKVVVVKFLKEGARANIRRWMQCVETTSARAGLLLCADLDVAKKVIQAQAQIPGDISPAERVKELMTFAVSDDYFTLRKTLGITIQTGEGG